MKKGISTPTIHKKREIRESQKYVLGVMSNNPKLSQRRAAKMFGIQQTVLKRLLAKRLTYVPNGVREAMTRAKLKAERAYFRAPEEMCTVVDQVHIDALEAEVKRLYEFVSSLKQKNQNSK